MTEALGSDRLVGRIVCLGGATIPGTTVVGQMRSFDPVGGLTEWPLTSKPV